MQAQLTNIDKVIQCLEGLHKKIVIDDLDPFLEEWFPEIGLYKLRDGYVVGPNDTDPNKAVSEWLGLSRKVTAALSYGQKFGKLDSLDYGMIPEQVIERFKYVRDNMDEFK